MHCNLLLITCMCRALFNNPIFVCYSATLYFILKDLNIKICVSLSHMYIIIVFFLYYFNLYIYFFFLISISVFFTMSVFFCAKHNLVLLKVADTLVYRVIYCIGAILWYCVFVYSNVPLSISKQKYFFTLK